MEEDLKTAPPEPEFDGLLPAPPEPEFDGLLPATPEAKFDGPGKEKPASTGNKKKNMMIGIAAAAVIIILAIIILCINLFGNKGPQRNGGLNTNMVIGGISQSSQESNKIPSTEASSIVNEEETKEKTDKDSADEGAYNSDKVPAGIEAPLDPPVPEEVSDAEWEMRKCVTGIFDASDKEFESGNILGPSIVLGENGTFAIQMNTGHSRETVVGNYSCSIRQNDGDAITVSLRVSSSTTNVPSQATIVFKDSLDYCEFMTEGFGIMGYDNNGKPPYGFVRI